MRFKMHGCSWQSAVRIRLNFSIQSAPLPYTRGMFPAIHSLVPLLVQGSSDETQTELYRQWTALMMVFILLCVIALTAFAFIVARRRGRRRMSSARRNKQGKPIADAWTEAGRRMDDSITEIRDDD
jgi:Na+/melibiose symporter-like transporter